MIEANERREIVFRGQPLNRDTDPKLLLDALAWAVNSQQHALREARRRRPLIKLDMTSTLQALAILGVGISIGFALTGNLHGVDWSSAP